MYSTVSSFGLPLISRIDNQAQLTGYAFQLQVVIAHHQLE